MGMIQEKGKHTGYSKQTGSMSISTSPRTDLREGSVKSPLVEVEAGFSKGKRGVFLAIKLLSTPFYNSYFCVFLCNPEIRGNPLRSETTDCQLEL